MSTNPASWENFSSKKDNFTQYFKAWEQKISSFLQYKVGTPTSATGQLKNLPFATKDNIAIEGYQLSCGSKILGGFTSPYTATVVKRLLEAGAFPIGKTNLDEFGMGSSNENSAFGLTRNPWDLSRVPGGSSGGSAAAVAAGLAAFALGSDTGGSVRQPASFCGVYGLKPTYGTLSRFGLVAYASSLEVIGIFAKTAGLVEAVYDTAKGIDPNDHTSVQPQPGPKKELKRIGILKGISGLEASVQKAYEASLELWKSLGYSLVEVEIPTLEYVVPAYYTIATAEASANLARYNGIRYGHRPEYAENPEQLIRKARSEGFGPEVKTRILLGTYVLRSGFQDQYYTKAQKIRTALRNDLDKVFASCDALLTPAFPTPAFPIGDKSMTPFQQKLADKFTVTANLAGTPALAIPSAVENGLPIGMQLMAPVFEEARLFELAKKAEKIFPSPDCPGYSTQWSL